MVLCKHHSDSRLAVRSLISLCLLDRIRHVLLRTGCHIHSLLECERVRHRASRKAPLCNVNSNSATGRVVIQLEAHFFFGLQYVSNYFFHLDL